MKNKIYLDNNAATEVDERVLQELGQHLHQGFGNPSSTHSFGRQCRAILTRSRDCVAKYLKVLPEEIIFTSGGTEGANMVIRGLLAGNSVHHVITSSIEHAAVFHTIEEFEQSGGNVTYLHPGEWGAIKPEEVESALHDNTKLIAIMAANNETGVKTDIEGIAEIAIRENIPFFVDGVALLAQERVHIPAGVSAMCFSGQKIHCIQGVGFCFVRKNLNLSPLITGGAQQFGRRGGTENLPGIVALAKAVSLLDESVQVASERMKRLRDDFEITLQENLADILINGIGPRVANTSNLCFAGLDGETLMTMLDMEGVAVSHGSACASFGIEPSRVLQNMGFSPDRVNSSIRFSLSRMTTEDEIESAITIITRVVKDLRSLQEH